MNSDLNSVVPQPLQRSFSQHLLVDYQTKIADYLRAVAEPEILYLRIEKQNRTEITRQRILRNFFFSKFDFFQAPEKL